MPPDKEIFAGRGASAIAKTKKLKSDVRKLSDPERRKRRQEKVLEASTADNIRRAKAGKKSRSVSQRAKDKLTELAATPKQRIRLIQGRAAVLREKASAVERSGTGNKKAAATFRQAATELLARIPKMRGKK